MANQKEKLFTEFPPITTEEWMDKITTDLKGASFEKKLVWRTNEGFNVNPFYRREDLEGLRSTESLPGEFPYIRGTRITNHWRIRQTIHVSDPVKANQKALGLLKKGIDSFLFILSKRDLSTDFLSTLLKDLPIPEIELNFRTCVSKAVALTKQLSEYAQKAHIDTNQLYGSIEYDPFKKILVRGVVDKAWADTATEIIKAASDLPQMRVIVINAVNFCNAGSYITQELGYALSAGLEVLNTLQEKGLDIREITHRLKFNFGISSNYFMEIAKFRAARWLWANIVSAYGDEYKDQTSKIHMHAETSRWNMTIYDAYVNLLRSQTEAMSAAIGGVDSITVLPFDDRYQEPDNFSERIARNQQLLLKEECHLDRVVDPSAGSFYIENLTYSIATEAWRIFLEVEEEGGFDKLACEGKIQEAVNASNTARHKAVATRRESLLGTNQFPNFNEVAGDKIKKTESGHCCAETAHANVTALNFAPAASEFEHLRLSTEHAEKRPKVFMLTIGNLAMRLARSQFSSNFFACAGYQVIDNLGFKTVEEGVDEALKQGADIITICSSDDEYADLAPAAFRYLNGRAIFVVAGNPASTEELKAAGIEYFVHVRSNVLEMLLEFNQKLGIK